MNLTFQEFSRLAKSHNLIPLCKEIVVDRLTPVAVYERLSAGEPYSFLLESVEGGEQFGRYSFVGQRPFAIYATRGNRVTFKQGSKTKTWTTENPMADLKSIFQSYKPLQIPELERFWGGAVGYCDYDTVRFFEKIPDTKPDLLGFPSCIFLMTGELIALDRFSQNARVISTIHIAEGTPSLSALKKLYTQAERSIERQISAMRKSKPRGRSKAPLPLAKPRSLTKRADYEAAVARAKEHIRAGDIIQVVLSQRWELTPQASPFQVYRALRMVNPSPYMYCLHFPEIDIVGSSPELLVRKQGQLAETRPIAGTRRRGKDSHEDHALAEELRQDPKERAEHLMLVDLGRNDLGRVCEPGSVKVPDLMTIENYSHVMHLVSSVIGELAPSANAFDLFQACFPAGTVSGAPKIRAMQIIDALEPSRRGPYAGAVGYFSYMGNMDMAITIRTLFFHGKKAYMQSGAGIVADSDPSKEFQECEHKAAALFAAVQKAQDLS